MPKLICVLPAALPISNPEQLFAAGWSACFIGAMGLTADRMKIKLPADLAVDAEVDLCNDNGEYFLQSGTTVCRWLVGLLHRRNGFNRRPHEDRKSTRL